MNGVLQRIATGPALSKDLTRGDAHRAMRLILEQRVDPVQAGVFLIALRMKRETDDELAGVLEAIGEGIESVPTEVATLVYLVDPYNGFVRGLPAGAFVAPVLAATGLHVITHGAREMGPKFGLTQHAVFDACGVRTSLTPVAVASQFAADFAAERGGWAYLEQAAFAPEMARLNPLRRLIVKRPCLTTVEVGVLPVRSSGTNHLVTGYVHKPYPKIYAQVAKVAGFDAATFVRGVEGGIVPSLAQPSRYHVYRAGKALIEVIIDPVALAIEQDDRTVPFPAPPDGSATTDNPIDVDGEATVALDLPLLAKTAAALGLAALGGQPGPMRDAIEYAAAVALASVRGIEPADVIDEVRQLIHNGQALQQFERQREPRSHGASILRSA